MNEVNRSALPPESVAASVAAGWYRYRRHIDTAATLLCIALLIVILVLAAERLFSGVTMVGMTGVDTFDYWRIANELLHGRYESEYHRFSFYALNALAMKLLGANDYAIRAFIGGFAVLNVALV